MSLKRSIGKQLNKSSLYRSVRVPIGDFITKYRNRLRIQKNHRQIIDCARSNDSIFLVPTQAPHCSGSPEHYYHFIFDLVLPLSALLSTIERKVEFVIHSIGPFDERLGQMFPDQLRIIPRDEPPTSPALPVLGMNPQGVLTTSEQINRLQADIFRRLEIQPDPDPKYILLIERMPPAQFYIEEATVKGGGTHRRAILNHEDLESPVRNMVRQPYQFLNLRLETLSFEEQIRYFNGAALVIAQHGAGLSNVLWMNPRSTVVEFNHKDELNHFVIISKARQHTHLTYETTSRHAEIDVPHFEQWVLDRPELRPFFAAAAAANPA